MFRRKKKIKPSALRIKTRLEIGSEEYRVVMCGEMKERTAGLCYYSDEKVLLVNTEQSRLEVIKTFCHEWYHGVEDEFKIELGHRKIEKLEAALAQLLIQLLR